MTKMLYRSKTVFNGRTMSGGRLSRFHAARVLMLLFFTTVGSVSPTWAEDFVAETTVKLVGQDQPVSRHTTYFTEVAVVDVGSPQPAGTDRTITILNLETDEMMIVDTGAEVFCQVTSDELVRTVAAIASRVGNKPEIVKFAAAPDFAVTWSEKRDQLNLDAKAMSYRVQTTVGPAGSATAYRRFADSFSRLNATHMGGLPPAARMELNRELGQSGLLPSRVEWHRKDAEAVIYSMHSYRQLSESDRKFIAKSQQVPKLFRAVDLSTLRLSEKTGPAKIRR